MPTTTTTDVLPAIKYRRVHTGVYEVFIGGGHWGLVEQDTKLPNAPWNDNHWWLSFDPDYLETGLLTAPSLRSLKNMVNEHVLSNLQQVQTWMLKRREPESETDDPADL